MSRGLYWYPRRQVNRENDLQAMQPRQLRTADAPVEPKEGRLKTNDLGARTEKPTFLNETQLLSVRRSVRKEGLWKQ